MPGSAMAPPRQSSNTDTIYTLALLAEYNHTLDALPVDLSKNFADLRELDAVLSASMSSLTSKVNALIQMIEQKKGLKEERLTLLSDIAEDAHKLKMGGEDKIRVACLAADTLKSHTTHLRTLADHIPDFDISTLNRKTTYPHVAARSFMPHMTLESGRRRRGGFQGSLLLANNPEPSPAKRKRTAKDDDIDIGPVKTPRKEKVETASRGRAGGRKKIERPASPSESIVSVTSHLPVPPSHPVHQRTVSSNSRGGNAGTSSASNKRARGGAGTAARNATPLTVEVASYPSPHDPQPSSHRRGHSATAYNVPPSSAHPSLPMAYAASGVTSGPGVPYDMHVAEWNPPHQLEGPGMPVPRGTSIHSTISSNIHIVSTSITGGGAATDGAATETGDGDGDGDDNKTYCICDGVSYGEMIACDDEQCEREWFHLTCIGLTVPPEGQWYCDSCKSKRNAKRSGRGGKRRAAGGRTTAGRA